MRDPTWSARLDDALQRFAQSLDTDTVTAPDGSSPWDQRYAEAHAAYGSAPNAFLSAVAGSIPDGPVLVLGAGEGRNAIFLARRGHDVTAVDQSSVALEHARALASRHAVNLRTRQAALADDDFGNEAWAGIVAIWTHLPPHVRRQVFSRIPRALQPGGVFVAEFYAPKHLQAPGTGGPPFVEFLVSPATARAELGELQFELSQEVTRVVDEGRDHAGPGVTTQLLARSPVK